MKKTAVLLPMLLWAFFACSQTQTGIAFEGGDWQEALAKARQTGKPLFLYAYTPGCQFCKMMEKTVFPDSSVVSYYNQTFVSYKADIEKGQGKALAEQYQIKSFPRYLYFDAEGKLLHMSGSAKPAAEFIGDGKDALDPGKAFFQLKDRYLAGDRSQQFLYLFSLALDNAQQSEELYEQVASEYFSSLQPQALKTKQNLKWLFNLYTGISSPATLYYLKHQQTFAAEFTQAEADKKTRRIIGGAAREAGIKGDSLLLGRIQKTVDSAMGTDARQWSLLARVNYLGGRRDWPAYADAALEYGRQYAKKDSYTLYETAAYLKYFAEEKVALQKALQVIRQALAVDESYTNRLLQAQLFQKLQQDKKARKAARKAIKLAKKKGENSQAASQVIAETETN